MECTVLSPCGGYQVQLVRGEAFLQLHIAAKSVPGKAGAHYTVQLDADAAERISTSAGVRKSFDQFAEMVYSALVGRSTALRFFVETCEEMNARISKECEEEDDSDEAQRQKHARNTLCPTNGLSLPTSALHISTLRDFGSDAEKDHASDGSISLDMSSELNEVLRNQLFFTIDYDVDFTRAVFPVPLIEVAIAANAAGNSEAIRTAQDTKEASKKVKASEDLNPSTAIPRPESTSVASPPQSTMNGAQKLEVSGADEVQQRSSAAALCDNSKNTNNIMNDSDSNRGTSSTCRACVERERLFSERERELLSVNQRLLVENDRFKRENEALIQMSREKMHEMQRICNEFQSRILDEAAFAELHRRLEETEDALKRATRERDHAYRQLDTVREERVRQTRQQSSKSNAHNAEVVGVERKRSVSYIHGETSRSVARTKSASRGASSARQGLSMSVHRTSSVSSSQSTNERRQSSRRYSTSRPRKMTERRFDTPPPPPNRMEEEEVRPRQLRRVSPSPRYPRAERRTRDSNLNSDKRRSNRFATPPASLATRGRSLDDSTNRTRRGSARRRTGSASSLRSETSTRSSRSSSASHERLYLTDTVSSRMHKREDPLQTHSRGHFAIFR